MEYKFFGHNDCEMVKPIRKEYQNIANPIALYDLLSDIWCKYSCAPRMRIRWCKENITLGQCSITSFLAQDIFGGEVFGVPLGDGSYHCFNVVNGHVFDLTSEQFGDEKLVYTLDYPQSRKDHFQSKEKEERYLYLVREIRKKLAK